ncbi:MAG: UbiD family decarboxylase [Burkholderiaceae bacterium]|jgi:4-hydroxy-3-polyprenylbenzoate decarboxylase|nr:UbiD family decarboxylase [Burkholderiaceae bacterium]MEB2350621.1 UbiD family decarboxylase [Burkholderiaceae bacterium]
MSAGSVTAPVVAERHSFRSFLAALRERGEVVTIDRTIDPEGFGISACLSALDPGPALVFTGTGASGIAVVGNLLSTIDRIAFALGVGRAELTARLAQAIAAPIEPAIVAQGPVQDVEMRPDLGQLPIPRFFEHETGPYITAGCIVAQDRVSGQRNLSYARVKPLGGERALIGIAPNHHLAVMARAAAARGERLPIAITLGNHPAVLLAAALYLKLGDDEMAVAGALLGEAVTTVRCRTSGLIVPAAAEIVVEGEIDVTETVEEGPVSEYHGMYERYGAGCVVTVRAITRRRDAMLQVIEPGFHREHVLLGAVSIAAGLQSHLKAILPATGNVAVSGSGCGRLSAVVALTQEHRPGDAGKAILATLSAVNLIKQVTIVDEDIDPWDEFAVQWAIATRLRAERDIVVVPGMRTDRSEPMKLGGTIAKVGYDATRRAQDRDDWTRALPPRSAFEQVAGIVSSVRNGQRNIS